MFHCAHSYILLMIQTCFDTSNIDHWRSSEKQTIVNVMDARLPLPQWHTFRPICHLLSDISVYFCCMTTTFMLVVSHPLICSTTAVRQANEHPYLRRRVWTSVFGLSQRHASWSCFLTATRQTHKRVEMEREEHIWFGLIGIYSFSNKSSCGCFVFLCGGRGETNGVIWVFASVPVWGVPAQLSVCAFQL